MNDISNILWHIIYDKIININNKLNIKSITRNSRAEINDYDKSSLQKRIEEGILF